MTRATEMEMSPAVSAEISDVQAGTLAAVAREEAEIKAAIIVARQFPRNETSARLKILKSCDRPSFADEALYSFPRGKGENATMVEGPSVNMARELARCWGNVQCDLRIVTEDEERVHIRGVAWDVETNTRFATEDKFKKLIQRRSGWVRPEERDLRELTNRRGAICLRNAILQIIPRDIVEDAIVRCNQTLVNAAQGNLKADPKKAVQAMVEKFDEIGVTIPMLEVYLKHGVEITTAQEFAKLRAIWTSIHEGNSKREEYFSVATQVVEVDLSNVHASAAGAAPRASTADSLKPTSDTKTPPPPPPPPPAPTLIERRIKVLETGTRAAGKKGPRQYVITAEWDGGNGVLTSTAQEHAKLSQEAADTGMLLNAGWQETDGVRVLVKLTRTDEPKDEAPRGPAQGPIDLSPTREPGEDDQ